MWGNVARWLQTMSVSRHVIVFSSWQLWCDVTSGQSIQIPAVPLGRSECEKTLTISLVLNSAGILCLGFFCEERRVSCCSRNAVGGRWCMEISSDAQLCNATVQGYHDTDAYWIESSSFWEHDNAHLMRGFAKQTDSFCFLHWRSSHGILHLDFRSRAALWERSLISYYQHNNYNWLMWCE
jgi:hypothetical protein